MVLEVKGLCKSYGERAVVADLDLSIEEGTIYCLLGESGCGKTTTLQMIGGFVKEDRGDILIDGLRVNDLPPEERPLSTVFQSYALFPHLSVIKNVTYGLRFRGLSKKDAVKKGEEYLEMAGLSEYRDAGVNEISGGQQQRVALARALATEPRIVLMDEPLSNLDAKLRVRIREELRVLQRKLNMTILFVTHDQEEAMSLADKMAVMRDGKILQEGTPRELYERPGELYIMDFLGRTGRIVLQDKSVIFVRPENITVLRSMPERDASKIYLRGTVLGTGFLGFYNLCTVLTGEGEEKSEIAAVTPSSDDFEEGCGVVLMIDKKDAVRF